MCVQQPVQCLFCSVVADWAVRVDFVCCCFDRSVFPVGMEWRLEKERERERERKAVLPSRVEGS